ncbi:oligopeptide ABC transporter (permease) [Ketogulonicigenium vulgare Y25]|nr:oligopeptide ABC transporter (permease) [Ketogulonicigenium vulgare Y25]AOZ55783.1 oligopeptide ABC transporter (permease) [Ketogulonicigenium vulgare]
MKSLLKSRAAMLGIVMFAVIVLSAVFADLLPLADPTRRSLPARNLPPLSGTNGQFFLLGSDGQGRDMLSRIIYGARASLIVGLAAVSLSAFIGLVVGLISGLRGGWVDLVLMRIIDAVLAIPTLLFMLVVALVVGSGLMPLIVAIAVTNWVVYARMVRAEVLRVKDLDFVAAARIARVSGATLLGRHILPNILPAFIVVATLNIGAVILLESSLSFLGFGIQAPGISWGQMLAEGRQSLATSWWVATFPGVAVTMTVFSIILLGDWLRDYLDPRHPA